MPLKSSSKSSTIPVCLSESRRHLRASLLQVSCYLEQCDTRGKAECLRRERVLVFAHSSNLLRAGLFRNATRTSFRRLAIKIIVHGSCKQVRSSEIVVITIDKLLFGQCDTGGKVECLRASSGAV